MKVTETHQYIIESGPFKADVIITDDVASVNLTGPGQMLTLEQIEEFHELLGEIIRLTRP